jgi:hypothetical protein
MRLSAAPRRAAPLLTLYLVFDTLLRGSSAFTDSWDPDLEIRIVDGDLENPSMTLQRCARQDPAGEYPST